MSKDQQKPDRQEQEMRKAIQQAQKRNDWARAERIVAFYD